MFEVDERELCVLERSQDEVASWPVPLNSEALNNISRRQSACAVQLIGAA